LTGKPSVFYIQKITLIVNGKRKIGGIQMENAKERMAQIIEEQPDDSNYEEILHELAMAKMIERGLADSREGRTISNEEMQHRIRTWQK